MADDVGGEIDFIMRRPNAGTELDNQIGSARPKMLRHCFNGLRRDPKLGPFLPGMHQANRAPNRIDQINRAAIGHVNAEAKAALIRDQAIAAVEAFVPRWGGPDHSDVISMHLLRGDERSGTEAGLGSDLAMDAVQAGERLRFVVRHLDPGHAQSEPMHDLGPRAERRKLFSRKLTFAHLLPVVVRVVVVRVLVSTGGRLPARFSSSGPGFGAGVGRASVLSLLRVKGSSSSLE